MFQPTHPILSIQNNKSMQMRSSDFQIRPKTMRAVSRPFISRAAITWARRSRSSCPSRPPSSNEPLGQSERCPAAAPISARLLLCRQLINKLLCGSCCKLEVVFPPHFSDFPPSGSTAETVSGLSTPPAARALRRPPTQPRPALAPGPNGKQCV